MANFSGWHHSGAVCPGAERNELLGEAGEVGNELRAEAAGEVSDNLCVESNPWSGAQLWNKVDRL